MKLSSALIPGLMAMLITGCSSTPELSDQDFEPTEEPSKSWHSAVTDPVMSAAKYLPSFSPMATLKAAPKLLPGVQGRDEVGENDPKMPVDPDSTLRSGHTLRLQVYEGARAPELVLAALALIDESGQADLGKAGTIALGNQGLPKAVAAIAAQCRVNLQLGRSCNVHLLSIDDVPLVSVVGEIKAPRHLQLSEDLTVGQAVEACGGRPAGSSHRALYLTRLGERRFFANLEAAADEELQRGDIVELSTDL
jgi:hypothetical protein